MSSPAAPTLIDALPIAISGLALLTAVASLAYTAWSSRSFRRADDLQRVRAEAVVAERSFNGLLNHRTLQRTTISPADAKQLGFYYGAAHTAYVAYKNRFSSADQRTLDALDDKVQSAFPLDGRHVRPEAVVDLIDLMYDFIKTLKAVLE